MNPRPRPAQLAPGVLVLILAAWCAIFPGAATPQAPAGERPAVAPIVAHSPRAAVVAGPQSCGQQNVATFIELTNGPGGADNIERYGLSPDGSVVVGVAVTYARDASDRGGVSVGGGDHWLPDYCGEGKPYVVFEAARWSGCPEGAGRCLADVNCDATVNADFVRQAQRLCAVSLSAETAMRPA